MLLFPSFVSEADPKNQVLTIYKHIRRVLHNRCLGVEDIYLLECTLKSPEEHPRSEGEHRITDSWCETGGHLL